MRHFFISFLFSLYFFISNLLSSPAFAQNKLQDTISVSPSIVRLDLQTDKPQALLTYTNNTAQPIIITLSAKDFTELEDSYKLSYFEGKDAQNYKYSLSSWIDFSNHSIEIPPHQSSTIHVVIDAEKLTPGAHYASVLAHISTKTNEHDNVQINSVLSSLLFVRTNTGRETEEGHIVTFLPVKELLEFPKIFLLRFNNTGDTDVIPYGILEVHDMFGHLVAKGILNDGSFTTLPESIRRYDIVAQQKFPFLFPGNYTATLSLHFGKNNRKQFLKTSFFSQGSISIIPIAIILILAAVIFFKWKRK